MNFRLYPVRLDIWLGPTPDSLIAQNGTGFTTTVNLLELCGILSFNLNEKQLLALWFYFQDRYEVNVLPIPTFDTNFPTIGIKEIFDQLKKRT